MEYLTYIAYEIVDCIGILQINRPKVRNALNRAVLIEMQHFLEATALEHQLKAVILTGSGEKAFIAGADIKEMSTLDQKQMMGFCQLGQNVANILETAPFVTIAAVNGYALGGGLEMALACDFIYASRNAILGLPEITLGIIPGFGGTQRLSRSVGSHMAKELILSGRTISAEEAKEIRLVNRVCDLKTLLEDCKKIASEIVKFSSPAILGVKNAINGGMQLSYASAFDLERSICAGCFETVERRKAMKAFLERK